MEEELRLAKEEASMEPSVITDGEIRQRWQRGHRRAAASMEPSVITDGERRREAEHRAGW